jgi:ribonuclease Z
MELCFLGTGAGMPGKRRNVSAIALQLIEERGSTWLFDCGEGTQHQILQVPAVKLGRIEKIFITHLHGDHFFGLPGLLGSRSFQGGEKPLTVYGPVGIKEFLTTVLAISHTHLTYPLHIEEFEEGLVFEDETFKVETRQLAHGIPSFGFRVTEKDRSGTLDAQKLQASGIEPGPLYAKLKKGETISLPDGRQFNGKDFLGTPKKGRVVAILGDTRRCKSAYYLAKGADVLVHEASFSAEHEKLAEEYFHSTTKDAAKIAKGAPAKKLILTHISARYSEEDEKQLLLEAQELFPNTEIAGDLKNFTITGEK